MDSASSSGKVWISRVTSSLYKNSEGAGFQFQLGALEDRMDNAIRCRPQVRRTRRLTPFKNKYAQSSCSAA